MRCAQTFSRLRHEILALALHTSSNAAVVADLASSKVTVFPAVSASSRETRGETASRTKVWILARSLSVALAACGRICLRFSSNLGVLVADTLGWGYCALTLLLFSFGTLRVHFDWRKHLVLSDTSISWLPSMSSSESRGKSGRAAKSTTSLEGFSILSAQLLLRRGAFPFRLLLGRDGGRGGGVLSCGERPLTRDGERLWVWLLLA